MKESDHHRGARSRSTARGLVILCRELVMVIYNWWNVAGAGHIPRELGLFTLNS